MNTKVLLLIIDMQNDFCSPEGALFVKGADDDSVRLGRFIKKNESRIDQIILTQDYHNVVDISHPVFWEDRHGKHPDPFTEINLKKILGGVWHPRFQKEKAIDYIRKLEKQGEFPHTIWPEHCIMGSHGAAFSEGVMDPVKNWARTGKYYEVITKGTHPLTEHFGALKANVPVAGSPETHLNTDLLNKFMHSEKIFVAGEAKSHCVATTIKQMLHIGGLAKKIHLIQDCMSDVNGFEQIALPIYDKAKSEGVRFINSTDSF